MEEAVRGQGARGAMEGLRVEEVGVSKGLTRELRLEAPSSLLSARRDEMLSRLGARKRLKGFRPGKAPLSHLRRLYGEEVMREVVEEAASEGTRGALEERGWRALGEPRVEVRGDWGDLASGRADLECRVWVELRPEIELMDFGGIKLKRPVVKVKEEEVEKALENTAHARRPREAREEGSAAEEGDVAVVDVKGESGELLGDGLPMELSGEVLKGWGKSALGKRAGETWKAKAQAQAQEGEGEERTYEVTLKRLERYGEAPSGDELAKLVGLEDEKALREALEGALKKEREELGGDVVKRRLLDALDAGHDFELPEGLVKGEAETIVKMRPSGETGRRKEWEALARRRVKLGLLFSELAQREGVEVSEREQREGLMSEARRYGGRWRDAASFARENPEASRAVRLGILEEKVTEYVLGKASVEEEEITFEELTALGGSQ